MCGIAAVINGTWQELERMAEAQKHRGIKTTFSEVCNMKVAFAYLPITDSNAPEQPFKSGSYTVWLNGYISNYRELAEKYRIPLTTNCDTELLAKFLDKFSESRLHELNGFFSVLYNDGERNKLFTDRYGIKQLYYYKDCTGAGYISSEVKPLLNFISAIKIDGINENEINDWKYSLGVLTDGTIYPLIKRVIRLPFNWCKTKRQISYYDAVTELTRLWKQSVERNRVTDKRIKTGVLLSGGVDSGMVAKWLQPDYCFSMDYVDPQYSEIENIKLNSTGIHYTMLCNQQLANEYAPKALQALDDLKAGSCYTNFALTELAAKHCTVLYSGAGGDEVFNGYTHRYSRPINEVIKRTDYSGPQYNITHKQYDWAYLRGILVVEDRMSGYHTMETRYPLLDNDLVDFALSLPDEYLENKRILKDISGLHPQVLNSPKRGFSNPYFTNTEWVDYALKHKLQLQTPVL